MRDANIRHVKMLIAQSMPVGADDRKLRGILGQRFARARIADYLRVLEDQSVIEFDTETERWKMVIGDDDKVPLQ
ncbi:unnamed protein product [marine sediment metagenome]|uniref:Uncharacterized protein n=1 Tax=marine sediment metagenome TaxID=412755 RepID=X1VP13_9ZZZZ